MSFTTFSLWIHLVAIVAWVGGLFSISFVVIPVLKSTAVSPEEAARLSALVLQRFARISREVIFLIFITGIFNVMNTGVMRGFNFSGAYLSSLLTKVVLFVAIVIIQAWQSQRLAPALALQAADPDATKRLQRQLFMTSMLSVILAVSVVLLGLGLRYR